MSTQIITLVFTDVVGSSAAKRDTDLGSNASIRDRAYLEAIQRKHLRLVRSAVDEHKGKEIMTMGDSFFLTFDEPLDALRCCAAIQQRLTDQPIDTVHGPLRLRMGIHVGMPEYFEGSWHGTDVDTAARVQSVASPRQIIVTHAARQILGEPMGIKFRPLGSFALNGVGNVKLWDADYDYHGLRPAALPSNEQKRRGLLTTAAIVAALLLPLLAFVGWFIWHTPALVGTPVAVAATAPASQINSIIVANFENKTSESVFDSILTQAFITLLQQSPVLDVVGLDHLRQSMKYLNKSPDDPITPEIAREIGVREGIKAYLSGTIVKLGNGYIINASAVNCDSGDALASAEAQAADKDHVMDAVSAVATSLRTKLGESLDSIQKLDTPLGQATTSSLEAFRYYSLGTVALIKGQNIPEASGLFQQALDIDPHFAMAYAGLGTAYYNSGEPGKAAQFYTRAHENVANVSERERLRIETFYDNAVTGNLLKAIDTLKLARQTYPKERTFLTSLGNDEESLGNAEEAITSHRAALALEPDSLISREDLIVDLTTLDRFEEAQQMTDEMLKLNNGVNFEVSAYFLYALTGKTDKMAGVLTNGRGRVDEDVGSSYAALCDEFFGRYAEADRLWRLAQLQAAQQGAKDNQAQFILSRLTGRYYADLPVNPAADIKAAATLDNTKATQLWLVAAAALCHQPAVAQPIMDQLAKQYPEDTLNNRAFLPSCRALFAMAAGQPQQARDALAGTEPFDEVAPTAYLRGLACLQLKDGPGAVEAFRKAVRYRGAVLINLLQCYGQAQLGLARAYTMTGDTTSAKKAYEVLLNDLWKDADADLPQLIAAKKEYATLK